MSKTRVVWDLHSEGGDAELSLHQDATYTLDVDFFVCSAGVRLTRQDLMRLHLALKKEFGLAEG